MDGTRRQNACVKVRMDVLLLRWLSHDNFLASSLLFYSLIRNSKDKVWHDWVGQISQKVRPWTHRWSDACWYKSVSSTRSFCSSSSALARSSILSDSCRFLLPHSALRTRYFSISLNCLSGLVTDAFAQSLAAFCFNPSFSIWNLLNSGISTFISHTTFCCGSEIVSGDETAGCKQYPRMTKSGKVAGIVMFLWHFRHFPLARISFSSLLLQFWMESWSALVKICSNN